MSTDHIGTPTTTTTIRSLEQHLFNRYINQGIQKAILLPDPTLEDHFIYFIIHSRAIPAKVLVYKEQPNISQL